MVPNPRPAELISGPLSLLCSRALSIFIRVNCPSKSLSASQMDPLCAPNWNPLFMAASLMSFLLRRARARKTTTQQQQQRQLTTAHCSNNIVIRQSMYAAAAEATLWVCALQSPIQYSQTRLSWDHRWSQVSTT